MVVPLLGQAVVTGLVTGAGLFLGNVGYDAWTSPSLSVRTEAFDGNFEATRLMVTNTGRRAAKDCAGKLTLSNVEPTDLVDSEDVAAFLTADNYTTVEKENLYWANTVSDGGYIQITADDREALDVYTTSENRIVVYSEQGLDSARCVLRPPETKPSGAYEGSVTITAANARSVTGPSKSPARTARSSCG